MVVASLWVQVVFAQAFVVPPEALASRLSGAHLVAVFASGGSSEALEAAEAVQASCRTLGLTLAQPLEETPLASDSLLADTARSLKLDAMLLLRPVKDQPGAAALTVFMANRPKADTTVFARGVPLAVFVARPRPRLDVSLRHQGLSLASTGSGLLTGVDFYRALERDDLAQRYVRLAWTRGAVMVVGALALIAGFVMAYEGFQTPPCGTDCTFDPTLRIAGLSTGGAGAVALLVGTFLSVHPASFSEQAELVRRHNLDVERN